LTATHASGGARHRLLDFCFGFACVFVGLSLPLPGVPALYVRAHACVAGWLLPSALASGTRLSLLLGDDVLRARPWSLTLLVEPLSPRAPISIPIDLRELVYLPSACFIALAVAVPLASWRQNVKLAGVGLLMLEPLLLGLVTLPVLSFLGGTGPVHAFELGIAAHALLQVLYRALVVSPSMTYVIPLLLWSALLRYFTIPKSEPFAATSARSRSISRST
jgi:hypothetical protein